VIADLTPAQADRLAQTAAKVLAEIEQFTSVRQRQRIFAAALAEAEQRGRDAALDAMRGTPDDGAIGRVEALAGELDENPHITFSAWAVASRIRDAIGAPATADGGGQ
jgi:hypothetical protein